MTLLVVAALVAIGWYGQRPKLPVLHAGKRTYALEVVTTTAAQEKGLSGRPSLPLNHGMLFSFTDSQVRCFWMKDMHFSVDMIWLNSRKQVLHIEPVVSPKTYPQTFCPVQPAQYVIELNAGQAKAAGVTTGQSLNF